MSPLKLVVLATIACTTLTSSPSLSWGPERTKQLTPVSTGQLIDVLDNSHLAEYGKRAARNRLGMAWAQVALESGRGTMVWNNNLGNIGPSRYSKVIWYFHSPGTRYRAFDDLEDSGRAYWQVIHRCSSALRAFDDGMPKAAASALKRCGYYGALEVPYASGLRSLFNQALVQVIPEAIRRAHRIKEDEDAKQQWKEIELRFPYTPACACSLWD